MEKGRLLEPKSPSGQNARLRAGIEKETEGLLWSLRATARRNSHCAPTSPIIRTRTRPGGFLKEA
jgi:hypothetical protein